MSLINQVLQDLDKRGASINIGEATIRVVHARSRRSAYWLRAAGAAGMLGVAGAAWMVWQGQQPRAPLRPAVPLLAAEARAVAVLPASQPVVAAVQAVVPRIDSVNPNPVAASGRAQTITIQGGNFKDASVTLRQEGGKVYADRPLISITPEQIVLKSKFGKEPKTWVVEVLNAEGDSSGPFKIAVQAPAGSAQPAGKQSAAASPPPASNRMSAVGARPTAAAADGVSKQPTQISLQQQADNEFRRAYQLMRQGRNTEALAGYEAALALDAGHAQARQTMVSLLLEKKRNADAERVLQDGLQLNPQQASFAMLLARLQVERNALPLALQTLLHALPYAEKQPDYLAFVAALLQRQNRHQEAIDYYQKALQLKPQAGVWLMGLGISLHAEQRNADARDAFKRALDSNTLSAELHTYVTQQLKEL